MQLDFKNKVLPHLLGIVSFYLIVVVYFSPIVFDGKMMFQHDILQWEGSAKEIMDYRETAGEEPLWTNSMFGGMPAYLISLDFPGDITNALVKILTLGLPHPINSLFFGMLGMYILLLVYQVRPAISMAGAWAFAFNTFHIISLDAGHNAKIWAICLIPMILAGMHLTFTRKALLGSAIFALALMLQLKFNHLQITYYTMLICAIYFVAQLIHLLFQSHPKTLGKAVGFLALGVTIAVLANIGRLATVYEYGQYSIRGEATLEQANDRGTGLNREYAFHWSQGIAETLTLVVPNFKGGASRENLGEGSRSEQVLRQQGAQPAQIREFIRNAPTYWGDQPGTGGPIYGGAIMVFLFVLGLIFAPNRFKYPFLIITLLSLMLAWGSNLAWFNYTMFEYFPGYNKFRAVTMAFSMALFAIPVLGCLGLETLFLQYKQNSTVKNLGIAFGIIGGLTLIFAVLPGIFNFRGPSDQYLPDFLASAIREDRQSMMSADAWRSFIFIALSTGLIFASIKGKIKATYAAIGIAVLVLVDVWGINKRYLDNDSFVRNPSADYFQPTPADRKMLADEDYFRVLNLENPFNEARTSYFHHSVGGYHGAKMRRYQDLIDRVLSAELARFIERAQEGDFNFGDLNALNMLNTKYFYLGASENQVFTNRRAMGPGWFPENIQEVQSNEEEINALGTMDISNTASLNTKEFAGVQTGGGTISLINYEPNQLEYTVEASAAGLAVFSEIFYPAGWKAYIDGQEANILRVNYLLRGLNVPQGSSNVSFVFEPGIFHNTKTLMVIFQYLIVVLLLAGLFLTYKNSIYYGGKG